MLRVGFEPTEAFRPLVLQTSAFDHSAIATQIVLSFWKESTAKKTTKTSFEPKVGFVSITYATISILERHQDSNVCESRRWDSNPRPIAYKAIALATELLRLSGYIISKIRK